jgi:hypothetical protein
MHSNSALELILSGDPALPAIVRLSLTVSLGAVPSVLDGLINRRVSETNEFAKGQFLNGAVWEGRNDNIGATRARLPR